MKALCWHGTGDVRVDTVPDPKIRSPRDAIVRITATAICGSDLHLYDGFMPTMEKGDVLGHEPMGVVVEVGSDVKNLKKGDRVVVPFTHRLRRVLLLQEDAVLAAATRRTRTPRWPARRWATRRPACSASRTCSGGFAGGQAEYLRVPLRRRRAAEDRVRTCPTRRCCSCPTSSRPATWRPRTPTSSRATRWRSGAAARSGSSPSRAPGCSAPGG